MNPSAFKAPALLVFAIALVAETLVSQRLPVFLFCEVATAEPDPVVPGVGLALITLAVNSWNAAQTLGFLRGKASPPKKSEIPNFEPKHKIRSSRVLS